MAVAGRAGSSPDVSVVAEGTGDGEAVAAVLMAVRVNVGVLVAVADRAAVGVAVATTAVVADTVAGLVACPVGRPVGAWVVSAEVETAVPVADGMTATCVTGVGSSGVVSSVRRQPASAVMISPQSTARRIGRMMPVTYGEKGQAGWLDRPV